MWLKALKIENVSEKVDNKELYSDLCGLKKAHKLTKGKSYSVMTANKAIQEAIGNIRKTLRNTKNLEYKLTIKNGKGSAVKFVEVSIDTSLVEKLYFFKMAFNQLVINERKLKKYKPLQTRMQYISGQEFPYFGNDDVGMVHAEPNAFFKMMIKKRAKRLYESKKPDTNDNYVGIEIECYVKENETVLNELLMPVSKNVHIKHDGSLHSHYNGYMAREITILAKESEFKYVVETVCNALSDKRIAARIDKTCGLHIHLDMRNRPVNTCFHNLVTAQSILKSMQPESRRKNKYCKNNTHKRFADTRWGRTRYKNINAQAYNRFETLEVRLHSGTADSEKIINWIELLTCIVNKQEIVERCPRNLKKFQDLFNVPMNVVEYMKMRINKFKSNSVEETGTTEEINNNNATNVA